MNWALIFFVSFALLTVGSAFYAVVLTRNVVRAAFALMGTFGGVAGLFGVLGADFLMAVQIIVYVGGILVLLLFAIMLSRRATMAELPGSSPGILGWVFSSGLVIVLAVIGVRVLGELEGAPVGDVESTITAVGELLLGKFLLVFEFIGVMLLGALIGAVLLTRKEVR